MDNNDAEWLLYQLLALIHRDGGQYLATHGLHKATEDAMAKILEWLDKENNTGG